MDLGLKDKVALVTASSTGLGFATAKVLVEEGAKVVLCSRSQERVDAAVAKIRETMPEAAVFGLEADVTESGSVVTLVEKSVAHFGGLDILVTNAGGPPLGSFDSTAQEAWDSAVQLTLMSAVRLVRAALPHLRKSDAPSILTITSFSVKQPVNNLLLSNVIRPAVIGLTKTLAQELGSDNIRVNSILPGWTLTDRVTHMLDSRAAANGTTAADEAAKVAKTIPLGRMGEPEEFAKTAAFLVSSAASFISGEMVLVDGGAYPGLL